LFNEPLKKNILLYLGPQRVIAFIIKEEKQLKINVIPLANSYPWDDVSASHAFHPRIYIKEILNHQLSYKLLIKIIHVLSPNKLNVCGKCSRQASPCQVLKWMYFNLILGWDTNYCEMVSYTVFNLHTQFCTTFHDKLLHVLVTTYTCTKSAY